MNVPSTSTPLPQRPQEDQAMAGEDGGVPALWRRGPDTTRMLAAHEEAKRILVELEADYFREHGRPLNDSEKSRLMFYQGWRGALEAR